MKRETVNGIRLEFDDQGTGEPVVMVHGALVAATFAGMAAEPALAGFRRVRVHRRGYAGSDHPEGSASLVQNAKDLLALFDHLGLARAHLVGHSSGGLISMRATLLAPERVATLTVLEPPMLGEPFGQQFMEENLAPVLAAFQTGRFEEATTGFAIAVSNPAAVGRIAATHPEAIAQAVRDCATFFEREIPGFGDGLFTPAEAPKLSLPVLAIVGEESEPLFQESQDLLLSCLPNVTPLRIPRATHFLQLEEPRAVAEGVAAFVGRHPIGP
jgi:pimeloyl-ACP methyl ester carboxylesterase